MNKRRRKRSRKAKLRSRLTQYYYNKLSTANDEFKIWLRKLGDTGIRGAAAGKCLRYTLSRYVIRNSA